MSIDAKIDKVTNESDGTAILHLVDRDEYHSRGQSRLTVLNPVPGLQHLEGECIWGNASCIMCGDVQIAVRESYTEIRLVDVNERTVGKHRKGTT